LDNNKGTDIPVVILCGGKGTRMREETEHRPKPLVHIGTKPILWHIMKIYASYNYKNFVLALGYKGELIKRYFYDYFIMASDFTINFSRNNEIVFHNAVNLNIDWNVTLVDTGLEAFKGARIKRIERFIDTPYFLMTYGDGVSDVNIKGLVDYHLRHRKIGTLTAVRPPSRFGDIVVQNGQVIKFSEKTQASKGLINGGFFVFNRDIFDYLSDDDSCDFEYGPLEKLAEDGQLMTYEHQGQWECMDNIRDIEHLNKIWKDNKAFWKIWD